MLAEEDAGPRRNESLDDVGYVSLVNTMDPGRPRGSDPLENEFIPRDQFLIMCWSFGVMLSFVTIAGAYGSTAFSIEVASRCGVLLNVVFLFASLFGAAPFVTRFGAQHAILTALICFFQEN